MWGVPRSVFMGRVVESGEPLWLDEDRDWALALHLEESETCSGCGQPRHESTAVEGDGAYAASAVRCHACAAMARESRKFSEAGGKSEGLTYYVYKK